MERAECSSRVELFVLHTSSKTGVWGCWGSEMCVFSAQFARDSGQINKDRSKRRKKHN